MLTPRNLLTINRARRHGIVNPVIAFQEAKAKGLEFAVLCAVLMKETSGGHNVFGHDPGAPAVGWGLVTATQYERYEQLFFVKHVAQGVGPMQLTFRGYQVRADKLGGCWKPRYNIRVGVGILKARIVATVGGSYDHKVWTALRAYNGSNAYADSVLQGVHFWRGVL